MPVTFLRHAPLPIKYQKRYIGRSDIDIDKSLFDFDKVKELILCDYDLVFASSLKRTGQTLEMMEKEYIVDSRLDEVEFRDEIEGKNFEEIEKLNNFKSEYLESFESWFEFTCKESLYKFRERIKSFIKELPKNREILICTHGGVLRELFNREFSYLEIFKCELGNILS